MATTVNVAVSPTVTVCATGCVVINGGAATTGSRTVNLSLASADAQTGIDGMQVSVDGVVDTEPVQPENRLPQRVRRLGHSHPGQIGVLEVDPQHEEC